MAVKLNTFHCLCLRRILRIRWQQRMTNKSVIELAEINDITCEVSRRAWNWLGHILRREGEDDSFTALGWAPKGRGTRGRPKTTWRRTVGKERNKAGWKSSWTLNDALGSTSARSQKVDRPQSSPQATYTHQLLEREDNGQRQHEQVK